MLLAIGTNYLIRFDRLLRNVDPGFEKRTFQMKLNSHHLKREHVSFIVAMKLLLFCYLF